MPRKFYERHSLELALATYISGKGWTNPSITIRSGFQYDDQIVVPMIGVYFLPNKLIELQMARGAQKSFERRVQLDAYMETEARAESISDDIMDFLDETVINIVDPSGSTVGVMYCPDSETISSTVLPPNLTESRVMRWRAIIQASLESHYNL